MADRKHTVPFKVSDLGPRARALIAAGHASYKDDEVIGHAADGVDVALGYIVRHVDVARLEAYLAKKPRPEDW